MNCSQCGAALAPNSGFCGACGKPVGPGYPPLGPPPQQFAAPPQGYAPGYGPQGPNTAQPPGPYGQPPQPYIQPPPGHYPPQGHYPPPGQFVPPPGQFPQGRPPGAGYHAPLKPYEIVLQQRLTRLTGHIYLAPQRLYFVCQSTKGGLAIAIGQGVGGLIGGAIAGLAMPGHGAAQAIDENTLVQACSQAQGSMIMDPPKIKKMACTIWTRGIWFDSKTYALPNGLSKELQFQLGSWCIANNVPQKGLRK